MQSDRRDDVEDFMASVLTGNSHNTTSDKAKLLGKQHSSKVDSKANKKVDRQPVRASSARRTRIKKPVKLLAAGLILIAMFMGSYFIWKGPISALLQPKSPFSQELKDKMGIPLYFPTRLPGTFKIETNSITQPESNVVIYTITDESGKRINITLQKQPETLNLEPLYSVLDDNQILDTKFGRINTGLTEKNISMTNVTTGKTWVLISMPPDTISSDQLIELINSLRV